MGAKEQSGRTWSSFSGLAGHKESIYMREGRKVAIVKVLADRGMGSGAAKLFFSLKFTY